MLRIILTSFATARSLVTAQIVVFWAVTLQFQGWRPVFEWYVPLPSSGLIDLMSVSASKTNGTTTQKTLEYFDFILWASSLCTECSVEKDMCCLQYHSGIYYLTILAVTHGFSLHLMLTLIISLCLHRISYLITVKSNTMLLCVSDQRWGLDW